MKALVSDPTGAIDDPAMPMLRLALQPEYMAGRLQDCLSPGRQFATGDEPMNCGPSMCAATNRDGAA
jgi:hypothetical protein